MRGRCKIIFEGMEQQYWRFYAADRLLGRNGPGSEVRTQRLANVYGQLLAVLRAEWDPWRDMPANLANDPELTRVSLVRHGDVWNPDDVYYGCLPGFRLSDLGREQAQAVGQLLRQEAVKVVYHSPMRRARQTAALIRQALPGTVPMHEDERLIEIHSPYDGRPRTEMALQNWDVYTNTGPLFEKPEDVIARILQFFEVTCRRHAGEHVVGVSHGDPVAFAILWACGQPVTQANKARLLPCSVPEAYPATASVATFHLQAGTPVCSASYSYRRP